VTVAQLIAILRRAPPHLEVRVTWEGVIQAIDPKHVWMAPLPDAGSLLSARQPASGPVVVWIDADDNAYKPKDAVPLC
jgi:hypothetical protein